MFNRDFFNLMQRIAFYNNLVDGQMVFIKPNGSVLVQTFGFQCSLPPGSVQLPEGSPPLAASVKRLMGHLRTDEVDLKHFTETINPPCREDRDYEILTILSSALFKDIQKVVWAAQSGVDTAVRPVLENVLLEINKDTWYFVATNGKMLHARLVDTVRSLGEKVQWIIPIPLAKLIGKPDTVITNCVVAKKNEQIFLFITLNGMTFRLASSTGAFPAWEKIIPNAGTSFQLPSRLKCKVLPLVQLLKEQKKTQTSVTVKVEARNLYVADILVASDIAAEDQEWKFAPTLLARFLKNWRLKGRMMFSVYEDFANLVGFDNDDNVMLAGMKDRV